MSHPEEWTPVLKVYDPLKAGSIDGTDTDPHDRAIIRALNSKYRPNKYLEGDKNLTLFIGRLNPKTTEKDLNEVFKRFGDIRSLKLIRDLVTGFSKRYAFVEYEDEDSAYVAAREANRMTLDHCEIFVDFECGRTLRGWIPRRLGGGFGGKKESGQLRFGGRDRPHKKPFLVEQAESAAREQERQSRYERQRDPYRRSGSSWESRDRSESRYVRRSRSHSRERDGSKSRHNRRHYDSSRKRDRSRSRSRHRDSERS